MPTLSRMPEEKLDEIIKECIGRAMTYKDIHKGNYRALEDDKKHTLEVTKQSIQALINQQIKSVLEELEGEVIDANYYIPNDPDDEYTSGEVVRLSTIQKIRSRYE